MPFGRPSDSIFGDQSVDLLGQLARECLLSGGRLEAYVGLNRERSRMFVRMAGAFLEISDLPNHPRRGRHYVLGRRFISYPVRVGREFAECRRTNQIGAAHRLDESFDAVSDLAFPDLLDESLFFELSDVVVDLLSRHSDSSREARRRFGLSQFAEYLEPQRMKRGGCGSDSVDDVHGCGHAWCPCVINE